MLVGTMIGLTAVLVLTAIWRVRATGEVASRIVAASPTVTGLGVMDLLQSRRTAADPTDEGSRLPRVSVIVPALNEEQSIDWVVENIPSWVAEVVLVDGLSVDGTELVVRDRCPDVVIVHQRSRGKGAALRAGFTAATGEIIVMIDADGSIDPREMDRYVTALVDGADFVKGSRNLPGGGSVDFTLLRHLGNLGFVWAANLLFRVRFTDLCYGYCAFWRRDLDRLALTADGFEIEMELVLSAVKAGMEIAEVPSMELERRAGDSNLNAWTDGKRVLKTLLRQRLRRLDGDRADQVKIQLAPVKRAAHNTSHWVPAGAERRHPLGVDRRRAVTMYLHADAAEEVEDDAVAEPDFGARAQAGEADAERRQGQRRSSPAELREVLVAQSIADAAADQTVTLRLGLVSRSA